jgi:glycosyltransferase involved in cell wall biosynthesis
MNILVVSKYYGLINGASKCTYELIAQWHSKVERIDVVCAKKWYRPEKLLKSNNIFFHPLDNFLPIQVRQKCKSLVNKNTIIYSGDDYGIYASIKAVPYVLTYHGNWPQALKVSPLYFIKGMFHIPMYILNFKFADQVVCPNPFPLSWICKFTSRVTMIRYGISLVSHNVKPQLHHPCLVTVGRMDDRKGKLLVDVINALSNIAGQPLWHLYIVGPILYEPLNRLIDNQRVFSLGYVSNVADYVKEADVFVLASASDLEPLALTEAMALGKPVVCFDVGGIKQVASHQTGALVPISDVKAFAQSALTLLYDEEQRNVKGKRAKEAVQEFDWEKSALLYLELFQELLHKKHKLIQG